MSLSIVHSSFDVKKIEAVVDEIAATTDETVIYGAAHPRYPGLFVICERVTKRPIRLQSYLGKCLPEKMFGMRSSKVNLKIRKALLANNYSTFQQDRQIKCISASVHDKNNQIKGVLAILTLQEHLDSKRAKTYSELLKEKAVVLEEATGQGLSHH